MLKIIGLLGIVAAAGCMGIMKAEELKERIRLLEDFQNLLLELKSRMNYFHEPLCTMFANMAKQPVSRAFSIPDGCLTGFHEKDGEISQIWAEKTRDTYQKTSLTSDDLEILCHVGSFLGQTDYANQQMQFDYTEKRLDSQLEEARAIYSQKGPMYRRIGFFAGGLAALVLI